MTDKVVFLAFRTDKATTDGQEVLACVRCHNKAWTVVYDDSTKEFPRLVCTACSTDGGTIGWADNE